MPGAANSFADENSIGEGGAVMRAFRANRKPVRLDMSEKYGLAESVTRNHLARTNAADLDPCSEVGTSQLVRMFAHFRLLRRLWARSRCATNAGATFVTRSFTCAF